MTLRYGINPHQRFHAAAPVREGDAPARVLNGAASLINWLDALNAWQLVHEARAATGLPAAASFKHVSPAGAALAVPLPEPLARAYEVAGRALSPIATAYVRARGADPKSSFGDFVALSEPVDLSAAEFLRGVVSDGVIAPGYAPDALDVLRKKKNGAFLILQANPAFEAPARETREVFGLRLTQDRNAHRISEADFREVLGPAPDDDVKRDLLLGLITLKYTQSNSIGYVLGGQMIGIGAGQQSRIDCTRLAGRKADHWFLRTHPKVLALEFQKGVTRQERINWRVRYIEGELGASEERALRAVLCAPLEPLTTGERRAWLAGPRGVSLVSDAFLPFRDNVDCAAEHGVAFIAEHGGSTRQDDIAAACAEHGITLLRTGLRLFHH